MIRQLDLAQTAAIVKGQLHGTNCHWQGVSTDTRTIATGELFVALTGPNFDGHDFIAQAAAKGAVAALVDRPVTTDLPTIQVADTLLALGQLAKWWRQQFAIPVIALTGSCGKTSTKSLIASILQQCGNTLATIGTLNNHIGVPLTLLRLNDSHQYAVIEMGANHLGEIAYVTDLTQPTIAFITNAGPAHLDGFGDLDGVARGKGEIFQGLTADGTALINADDTYADFWRQLAKPHRLINFGISATAEISATTIELTAADQSRFTLRTPSGDIDIQLPLPGQHNVANAVAAAAAAYAARASLSAIQTGLAQTEPVAKRLRQFTGYNDATIIDDSYNANPLSFQAAIQVLQRCPGERILVVGDMGELGPQTESYHLALGEQAAQAGIEQLFACGDSSRFTAKAFGQQAKHFTQMDDLIVALRQQCHNNTTILIKGSRSAQMERVVNALQ